MTEREWLESGQVNLMLDFLRGEASDRKLRLFACACCRRIWHLLDDPRSRRAVEVAEGVAQDRRHAREVRAACRGARLAVQEAAGWPPAVAARTAAWYTARGAASRYAVWDITWFVAWHAARAAAGPGGSWEDERAAQADLLREVVGNPFRPASVPRVWPGPLLHRAEAFARGEDCREALHEALLEWGYTVLAEHFRQPDHPRGCWALDLLLSPGERRHLPRRRGRPCRRACEGS